MSQQAKEPRNKVIRAGQTLERVLGLAPRTKAPCAPHQHESVEPRSSIAAQAGWLRALDFTPLRFIAAARNALFDLVRLTISSERHSASTCDVEHSGRFCHRRPSHHRRRHWCLLVAGLATPLAAEASPLLAPAGACCMLLPLGSA